MYTKMKPILWVISVLALLATVMGALAYDLDCAQRQYLPAQTAAICYQETANVSTACGGFATGTYGSSATASFLGGNFSYAVDGDYSAWSFARCSANNATVFMNYTKPTRANNESLWQKRGNTFGNRTIPTACWNYLATQLNFRAISACAQNKVSWQCQSGATDWTLIELETNNVGIYEEAMYWNLSATAASNTTCTVDETLLLYLSNTSNSHTMLINDTSNTKYPVMLCCNSSAHPVGNLSNGTLFAYLSSSNNSHTQEAMRVGLATNYTFPVFISSSLPQPTCGLYDTSCPTGYTCLFSMWNRTNSHVGPCVGGYTNLLCCINRGAHQWTTIPGTTIAYNPTASTSPTVYVLDLGPYISQNYSAPSFTASSDSAVATCSVVGNTLYIQNVNGGDISGTCTVNSTEPGFPISSTQFTFGWLFAQSSGGTPINPGGGGGAAIITPPAQNASNLTGNLTGVAKTTSSLTGYAQMAAVALVIFLVLWLLNWFIVKEQKKKKKKKAYEEAFGIIYDEV